MAQTNIPIPSTMPDLHSNFSHFVPYPTIDGAAPSAPPPLPYPQNFCGNGTLTITNDNIIFIKYDKDTDSTSNEKKRLTFLWEKMDKVWNLIKIGYFGVTDILKMNPHFVATVSYIGLRHYIPIINKMIPLCDHYLKANIWTPLYCFSLITIPFELIRTGIKKGNNDPYHWWRRDFCRCQSIESDEINNNSYISLKASIAIGATFALNNFIRSATM